MLDKYSTTEYRFFFYNESGKELTTLAIHKSAIKRARQNEIRNLRNKSKRTRVTKQVRAAIAEGSSETAQAALAAAIPVIDKAAQKGALHHNTASRKVSKLTRQVNALSS